MKLVVFVCVFGLSGFISCKQKIGSANNKAALFELLSSSKTGIHFNNEVHDSADFNIFNFRNFYNGSGVAIGDINNDGKPDLFFTSNQHEQQIIPQ